MAGRVLRVKREKGRFRLNRAGGIVTGGFMTTNGMARLAGSAIVILALIVVAAGGTYIVPPGHRGVLVTLGKVSPAFKPEGFGWKPPFISTVYPVPIKQKAGRMNSSVISKDLQEVKTKLTVLYRIPEESVVEIYQEFKGDPFLSLIQPRVDEAIKEVTKEHTAPEIVQNRSRIKEQVLESARRKVGDLLTVSDVVVEDISLSANLESAIERKMVQEQEANKAVFEQQRAEIEAEIAVIRAKGEAESIRIRGEALATNPELIDLEIVRKWNGRVPRAVGGNSGGAEMILPLGPPPAVEDGKVRSVESVTLNEQVKP